MHAGLTLVVPRGPGANANDLRLPAINVGRTTLCPSSLPAVDRSSVGNALELIALRNQEPDQYGAGLRLGPDRLVRHESNRVNFQQVLAHNAPGRSAL